LFADYNGTTTGRQLWTLGPGIERLGKYWEFRANGYFPVSTHEWTKTVWADQVGDFSFRHATGNEMLDAQFIFHEEAGAGTDAEIGARLFKVGGVITKLYANGYYFAMHNHEDVVGGGGRLTFQKTRAVKFSINDSYDNFQHNRFTLGVEASLYDLFSSDRNKPINEDDLQPRLNDPIERDFAVIGSGASAVTGEQREVTPPSPETLSDYYFDAARPAGDLGTGTAEDPFNNIDQYNQAKIDWINQDSTSKGFNQANIYFKGFDNRTYTDKGQPISLSTGQWLFGTDTSYQYPAAGDNRPIIEGQLILNGNNHIDSFIFLNKQSPSTIFGTYNQGLIVNPGKTDILFNNVQIGSSADDNQINYATGIDIGGSSIVNVTNSTVFAYRSSNNIVTSGEIQATGIHMGNNSTLTVDNTIIDAQADAIKTALVALTENGVAYGIHADGQYDTITIQNGSKISAAGTQDFTTLDASSSFGGNGYGVLLGKNLVTAADTIQHNSVTINSSTITGSGSTAGSKDPAPTVGDHSGNGYGLVLGENSTTPKLAANLSIHDNNVNINASSLEGTGTIQLPGELGNGTDIGDGNGYGALVGYGYAYTNNPLNPLSIYNNAIAISASTLTGSGTGPEKSSSPIIYSNNGYGLLLGAGYIQVQGKGMSIDNNTINIANSSKLTGSGSEAASAVVVSKNSNDGYGLLLGYGFTNPGTSLATIGEKGKNTINVLSGSILTGTGTAQAPIPNNPNGGYGYGLLVGFGNPIAAPVTDSAAFLVANNQVTISNAKIYGNSLGKTGYAYGVAIGLLGNPNTLNGGAKGNSLSVSDSTITLDSNNRDAYGIWMNLKALNSNSLTYLIPANFITRDAGSLLGNKVSGLDNTPTLWT
jgi:hypothetical protein